MDLQNMHGRYHLTAAEFRTLLARLDHIAGVFKQLPWLNPPVGFEIEPFRHIEVTAYSTDQPASAPVSCDLMMLFWDYLASCPTCKAVLSTEASGELRIWVNVIGVIYDAPRAFRKDAKGEMYLEPGIAGEVGGFPEYESGYIVITRIKRPLWLPVSQERFIRSEIAPWASQIKGLEKNRADGTLYDQWLREREKRLKQIEDTYQFMRQWGVKGAEEYRDQALKIHAEHGEQFKKEHPKELARMESSANQLKQMIKALEDELASLSPSERAAPAYYRPGYRSGRPSGLASADVQGAQRVIETNKAFFDASLPKTSFQLLAVHGLWRVEEHLKEYPSVPSGRTDRASAAFLLKKRVDIRRSLNWKGLQQLLDEPGIGSK